MASPAMTSTALQLRAFTEFYKEYRGEDSKLLGEENLGYNFEHNYGHGKKFLSKILCLLMLLAFFIDQIQGMTCNLFQAVKKQAGTFQAQWGEFRTLFKYGKWVFWEHLYRFIIEKKSLNSS
jgi:hypothetical protein